MRLLGLIGRERRTARSQAAGTPRCWRRRILLEAKAKGIIDNVRPYLDALRQTAGFYLSDSLYRYVLTLTGESDG